MNCPDHKIKYTQDNKKHVQCINLGKGPSCLRSNSRLGLQNNNLEILISIKVKMVIKINWKGLFSKIYFKIFQNIQYLFGNDLFLKTNIKRYKYTY